MSLISAQHLSKFYGDYAAIEGVSFSIEEGEIVGLLGLNGAGKSTILKILGSFLLPSGGDASISGFSVEHDAEKVRSLIGYLPDTPPLYDEMRVIPYLRYVAKLKNVPDARVEERVADVIQKTNLEDVAWVQLGELSHGFRQRVGIAQALVHDPKVLILDEPINGLDPVQIVEMRDLILSLRGRHTVILSSHILSEITKTCDRILIIDQGKLVAEGNEADLENKFAKNMRVNLEVKGGQGLEASLKSLAGVKSTKTHPVQNGMTRIEIECEGDLRSEIASKVIASGASLYELGRDGDGLEAVFMKLVKTSEGKAQRGAGNKEIGGDL
ncbi:MAG: ABC transporter ATP-binding protein [Proteobacteria bacterium]|nr:ABC transporter ATP-binding protein [Pseudomonadota bacterium]